MYFFKIIWQKEKWTVSHNALDLKFMDILRVWYLFYTEKKAPKWLLYEAILQFGTIIIDQQKKRPGPPLRQ